VKGKHVIRVNDVPHGGLETKLILLIVTWMKRLAYLVFFRL